jgi:hypothetical protein
MRIDSQGGIIILSGTVPGAGAGWPRNAKSKFNIGAGDVPSGSLSLISLMDGTYGKSQPTLNFVSWTGTDGDQGAISTGDELGRITWWSSDNQLGDDNDRCSAFIQAVASLDHNPTNYSPSDIEFFTRSGASDASPERVLTIDRNGLLTIERNNLKVGGNQIEDADGTVMFYFDGAGGLRTPMKIKQVGAGTHVPLELGTNAVTNDQIMSIENATLGGQIGIDNSDTSFKIGLTTGYEDFGATAITIDASLNTTLSGTLQVGGNIIKASDGGNTITMDTSDNVTIGGDLTVGGNDIKDSGGNIFIGSDGTGNINDLGTITSPDVRIKSATTSLFPVLHLESLDSTAGDAGVIRFERYDDAVIQVGETIGEIKFAASETNDGTYYEGAAIEGQLGTGTWTDGSSRPGRLSFYTVADGSTTQTERLRIDSDGTVSTLNGGDMSVKGSLEAQGGATFIGDLILSGGIRTGTSIHLNSTTTSNSNYWIKIAEVNAASANTDAVAGSFLVTIAGYEYTGAYSKNFTMLINARYTVYTSSGYYYDDGTTLTCEAWLESPRSTEGDTPGWTGLRGFDPSTDLVMRIDASKNAEIWIKGTGTLSHFAEVYVNNLANTDLAAATAGGWTIPQTETMAWQSATPVGAWISDVFGNWMTKISGTNYSPGGIIGHWSDNPSANALYIVPLYGSTYGYISDNSPASQFAVTFNAPPSGKVKVTLSCVIDGPAVGAASALYMALSTDGSTFANGLIINSQTHIREYSVEMDDSQSRTSIDFIVDSLTWGSEYTLYAGAAGSIASDFYIRWGGYSGAPYSAYGPGIMEVVALPA